MFIGTLFFFYIDDLVTLSCRIIINYLDREIAFRFYSTAILLARRTSFSKKKIKIFQFWHLQCLLQALFNYAISKYFMYTCNDT